MCDFILNEHHENREKGADEVKSQDSGWEGPAFEVQRTRQARGAAAWGLDREHMKLRGWDGWGQRGSAGSILSAGLRKNTYRGPNGRDFLMVRGSASTILGMGRWNEASRKKGGSGLRLGGCCGMGKRWSVRDVLSIGTYTQVLRERGGGRLTAGEERVVPGNAQDTRMEIEVEREGSVLGDRMQQHRGLQDTRMDMEGAGPQMTQGPNFSEDIHQNFECDGEMDTGKGSQSDTAHGHGSFVRAHQDTSNEQGEADSRVAGPRRLGRRSLQPATQTAGTFRILSCRELLVPSVLVEAASPVYLQFCDCPDSFRS